MKDIYANDVISQHIGNTIRDITKWNVQQGSGDIKINAWALKQIANELQFCWKAMRDLGAME